VCTIIGTGMQGERQMDLESSALSSDAMSLLAERFAHELLREIEAAADPALTPDLIARYRALVKVNTALAQTLSQFRPHLASLPEFRASHEHRFTQGLPRWQVKRAHEFITVNLGDNISTADVAAACELSRSYFTSAFRKATGDTPHLYLLKRRIQRAKELLLGTRCIADIALTCGFADQAHLTRTFAKHTGVAPGLWRRERRQEPPQKVRT
jgi:AraC-like DNA-binding protein